MNLKLNLFLFPAVSPCKTITLAPVGRCIDTNTFHLSRPRAAGARSCPAQASTPFCPHSGGGLGAQGGGAGGFSSGFPPRLCAGGDLPSAAHTAQLLGGKGVCGAALLWVGCPGHLQGQRRCGRTHTVQCTQLGLIHKETCPPPGLHDDQRQRQEILCALVFGFIK